MKHCVCTPMYTLSIQSIQCTMFQGDVIILEDHNKGIVPLAYDEVGGIKNITWNNLPPVQASAFASHYSSGSEVMCFACSFIIIDQSNNRKLTKDMRRPGIEPGPPAWQARIVPLNHRRCYVFFKDLAFIQHIFFRFVRKYRNIPSCLHSMFAYCNVN